MVGERPGTRGNHGKLMHGEEHAHCLSEVLFTFGSQNFPLGRVEVAVLRSLQSWAAAHRDNEAGVQPDGKVLQAVDSRFAGLLTSNLGDNALTEALYGLAITENLNISGFAQGVGVQTPVDELAEVVHRLEVGESLGLCSAG